MGAELLRVRFHIFQTSYTRFTFQKHHFSSISLVKVSAAEAMQYFFNIRASRGVTLVGPYILHENSTFLRHLFLLHIAGWNWHGHQHVKQRNFIFALLQVQSTIHNWWRNRNLILSTNRKSGKWHRIIFWKKLGRNSTNSYDSSSDSRNSDEKAALWRNKFANFHFKRLQHILIQLSWQKMNSSEKMTTKRFFNSI